MKARKFTALLIALAASQAARAQDVEIPSSPTRPALTAPESDSLPSERPLVLPAVSQTGVGETSAGPGESLSTPAASGPIILPPEASPLAPNGPVTQALGPIAPMEVRPAGGQAWFNFDYVAGFLNGMNLPPLATTSPTGTPKETAGVLFQTGTRILFGDNQVNDSYRHGFRFDAGYRFGNNPNLSVQLGYRMIFGVSRGLSASSDGDPIIARPFENLTKGANDAVLVAFPGVSTGTLRIDADSQTLYNVNLNVREIFLESSAWRFESLLGYRYIGHSESVEIESTVSPQSGVFVAGTQIFSKDSFSTYNGFHGVDMGVVTTWHGSRLNLELLTKLAVGPLHHRINIDGSTRTSAPGAADVNAAGGLLALPSNIRSIHDTKYTVSPEIGLTATFNVTTNAQFRLGYNFMLLQDVVRAGNVIDTSVNDAQIPPATGTGDRPRFLFSRSDLVVQSINIGFHWQY